MAWKYMQYNGETGKKRTVDSSEIKLINVPYDTFTWDATQKAFGRAINLDTDYIIGFTVTPLNGMASMSAYYSSNTGYLWVVGFIPKTGASIDDTYEFICSVMYKL